VPLAQPPRLDQIVRAFNKASDAAMAVNANVLTVDTTRYGEYEDFKRMVVRCLEAVTEHGRVSVVERIGLRYVNEIRVPATISDARDWSGWVNPSLVEFVSANAECRPVAAQSVVQYLGDGHTSLAFRFGASPEGQGVIGNDPLRRRSVPPDGPFFVLDLDSYFQPPTDEAPDWQLDTLVETMDMLHKPIGATFQSAITERLRDEVFRGNS
jgi:uncharacterized protein (TIGR04255 family)